MLSMHFAELPSTHLWAKAHFKSLLAQHQTSKSQKPQPPWGQLLGVVTCDEQTAGIGRRGDRWLGARGNLFATYLLDAPVLWPPKRSGFLALALGASLLQTLEMLMGPPTRALTLKWPNDLVLDGGKVAGMLVELHPTCPGVLLSLGVNLVADDALQKALVDRYAHLGNLAPPPKVLKLLSALTKKLASNLELLWKNGANPFVHRLWEGGMQPGALVEFSRVSTPALRCTGRVCGLDEWGKLLIESGNERVAFTAGQLAHLHFSPKAGS